MADTARSKKWVWAGLAIAVFLMVGLRCVALDSDAYPRLSWSSALLTDEGFYIHDARNRVLFGHPTDQFSNALIMPVLDAVQTGMFHLFGVSVVSARAISVVLGLLTLPVFFDAMRRAFGLRPAVFALLLLGLDHVSLLYSRLALMDTPAAFVLVCAFWLWVKSGEGERANRGKIWLALCGLALGACYGVRGLGALVYPVPMLLLAQEGWKARRHGQAGESSRNPEWPGRLVCLVGGLGIALGTYVVLWYLPHHDELKRVNHYYLFEQLVPHRLSIFLHNWTIGLFGDHRGLMPYLVRHEPVQTCLVSLWLAWRATVLFQRREERVRTAKEGVHADYLALWLLVFWILLCSIDYAPSRYYVLFLPAFAGLAGLTLSDVVRFVSTLKNRIATPIYGLFVFHVAQTALHHLGISGRLLPGLFGGACLVLTWFLLPRLRTVDGEEEGRHQAFIKAAPLAAVVVWCVVNLYWTGDWLVHISYRQREADRWLAENLPANSVLIGAVTPGLTMNNRFVCVNVIQTLCNDHQPLERFAPAPRYVLILDDRWREVWWQRHYPEVIAPERRIHAFRGLLRPFFVIGVYKVPDEIKPER